MSVRADVLLWAQRVLGRKGATASQILDIEPGAGPQAAQEAFHKIARMAHPDLHRRTLPADELELVTSAYARAAAAYQELRGLRSTTRIRPIRDAEASSPAIPTTTVIPTSPASNRGVAVDEPAGPGPGSAPGSVPGQGPGPAQAMGSRALIYYRKAELALRRGDLTGAVLQLKMAIASDPQSTFLRSALTEVEAEVLKKP
jgi:hypothetical protein